MLKRILFISFIFIFISFSSLKAQDAGTDYHDPWFASPTFGIRQWNYTSIELGLSRGIVSGATGGYNSGGHLNASYFSVAADVIVKNKPVYDVELGYWKKLGDQHYPVGTFITIGIHALGYFDGNSFLPGISLPEPAINFSSDKRNPVVFQFSYRYKIVLREESIPGFSSSEISLVIYRSHNSEFVKVYH
ncbi:MAG TPA: hypothetical protein VL651_08715 [Bacteroidia bacterium]|nr:hypothetical protein [Bacteroidia bacterium]